MFAIRNAILQAPRAVNTTSVRTCTVISGRPRVRIPFYEKVMHGIAIGVAMLATPTYVLLNLKYYNGRVPRP